MEVIGHSAAAISIGETWFDPDRIAIIVNGLLVVASTEVRTTSTVVHKGIIWIDLDSFGKVADCLVAVSFVEEGCSAVERSLRVARRRWGSYWQSRTSNLFALKPI